MHQEKEKHYAVIVIPIILRSSENTLLRKHTNNQKIPNEKAKNSHDPHTEKSKAKDTVLPIKKKSPLPF